MKPEELAAALKAELSFPDPNAQTSKPNLKNQRDFGIIDAPPDRGGFVDFQRENSQPTAKNARAEDVADNEIAEHLLCMVDGDFAQFPGTDVEHGMSFSDIKKRQIEFLDFLNNSDKDFVDAFLGIKFADGSAISDFFQRDKKGKVKGTGYFYRICYNNYSNLWVICHACNIQKSSHDSISWLAEKKTFYGPPFKADVDSKGGVQQGVIFKRIGGVSIGKLSISGEEQDIYTGGLGIGEYAHTYFMTHHNNYLVLARKFYTQIYSILKSDWQVIKELQDSGEMAQAAQQLHVLQKKVRMAEIAFNSRLRPRDNASPQSPSSQEPIEDEAISNRVVEIDETWRYFSHLEVLMKVAYPSEETDIHEFFKDMRRKVSQIHGSMIINDELKEEVIKLIGTSPTQPWSKVKTAIEKLHPTVSEMEKSLKLSRKEHIAAEQEAKDSIQQLEKAKQETAEAMKTVEETKKVHEQLKKQLEEMKIRLEQEAQAKEKAEREAEEAKRKVAQMERKGEEVKRNKASDSTNAPPTLTAFHLAVQKNNNGVKELETNTATTNTQKQELK